MPLSHCLTASTADIGSKLKHALTVCNFCHQFDLYSYYPLKDMVIVVPRALDTLFIANVLLGGDLQNTSNMTLFKILQKFGQNDF